MKNILQIIKNNLSFTIIIFAIISMLYFGYQLISPIFSIDEINSEDLKFDKIADKLKI
jgi:hypothetical protein